MKSLQQEPWYTDNDPEQCTLDELIRPLRIPKIWDEGTGVLEEESDKSWLDMVRHGSVFKESD